MALLQKKSKKIQTDEEIIQVASISSGDEKIGKLISKAMNIVTKMGL